MKKMRLNPDQLAVQSFPTDTRDQRVRGTVQGRENFDSDGCGSAGSIDCDATGANCTEGCEPWPSFSAGAPCCDVRDTQPTAEPGCIA